MRDKKKPFDISAYDVPSFSFLKELGRKMNPAQLIYERLHPTDPSDAQIQGSALDCMILSPDLFSSKFFVSDKEVNTDTENFKFVQAYLQCYEDGDEHKAAIGRAKSLSGHRFKVQTLDEKLSGDFTEIIRYIQESEGRQSISTDLYNRVSRARDYVMANSSLPDYLHGAETLKKVEWTDRISGVKCRGEIDVNGPGYVLDLKKAVKAKHDIFGGKYGPIAKLYYAEQVVGYAESQRKDPTPEELTQELEDIEAEFEQNAFKPLPTPLDGRLDAFIFAVELHPMPGAWSMHKIGDYDYIVAQERFAHWCRMFRFLQEKNLWNLGYEFKFYEWAEQLDTFILKDPRFISETNLYL